MSKLNLAFLILTISISVIDIASIVYFAILLSNVLTLKMVLSSVHLILLIMAIVLNVIYVVYIITTLSIYKKK